MELWKVISELEHTIFLANLRGSRTTRRYRVTVLTVSNNDFRLLRQSCREISLTACYRLRKSATPFMNICTANITSNIPISLSMAISPRCFSTR